jgi:hypothetical protein
MALAFPAFAAMSLGRVLTSSEMATVLVVSDRHY